MKHAVSASCAVLFALATLGGAPAQAQNFFDKLGDTASDVYKTLTSGFELEKAKEVTPDTDVHGETLYKGYLELSQSEFDKGDYTDSDAFAERAMAAARNEAPEPEQIASRELRAELLNELSSARRRIVVAQARGALGTAPAELAHAQIGYECWMEEQEEDFQSADIKACKDRYFAAIDTVEASLKQEVKFEPKVLEPLRMDVFFDFDSAKLEATAVDLIRAVVDAVGLYKKPIVSLTGHADRTGDENYNFKLAQERAEAVAAELVLLGVKVDGKFSYGEEAPLVDGTEADLERFNRRVSINIREDTDRQ